MGSVLRHEVQRNMFSKEAAATIRVQCQFSSASPIRTHTFLTSCLRDQSFNNHPRLKISMNHTIRTFSQSSRFNKRVNQDREEELARQLCLSIRAKSSLIERLPMWEMYVFFRELKKHGLSHTQFYKHLKLVNYIAWASSIAITAFIFHRGYLESFLPNPKFPEGSQKDDFKEQHGGSR